VTRKTLDPLLRELTVNTPGVEFFAGWAPTRVIDDASRVTGVEIEDRERKRLSIRTRLLVAADGRDSTVARLARVPGRVRPHDRFFYFAYWRGLAPRRPALRVWFLEPEGGAEFPAEDGITLVAAGYHRSALAEVRADLEGSYMRQLAKLPDGPGLSGAERVSKVMGKIEMPNVIRPAARPGIAFVGDAALAADPVFGVGIGFGFQSAEWLVDETAGLLATERELDQALRRYARKFLWRLGPHHLQMCDLSTGRSFNPVERLALRRAAVDPVIAHAFGEVMTRERSPLRMMDPRIAARIVVPRPAAA
jgi:flavin-dependent dehydrogenase